MGWLWFFSASTKEIKRMLFLCTGVVFFFQFVIQTFISLKFRFVVVFMQSLLKTKNTMDTNIRVSKEEINFVGSNKMPTRSVCHPFSSLRREWEKGSNVRAYKEPVNTARITFIPLPPA